MKLKDYHMQRYLIREQLFVGWNIEIFDGDNNLIHGPPSITTHMPTNAMDRQPCVNNGKDNQLVGALA
jgi:hypothetical protein